MDSSNLPINPYASTEVVANPVSSPMPHENRMVGHLMAVGILQIVFGCLELIMGMFLAFYAVFFSVFLPNMKPPGQPPMDPNVIFGLSVGFGIGGVLVIGFSILRIASGIGSFWFRGRVWMLASLIGGMVTALTCYCAPFSIGIGVYGLIVVLSPAVRKAYEMRAAGIMPNDIKAQFARAQFGLEASNASRPMP